MLENKCCERCDLQPSMYSPTPARWPKSRFCLDIAVTGAARIRRLMIRILGWIVRRKDLSRQLQIRREHRMPNLTNRK
jgi:hypothetical protein